MKTSSEILNYGLMLSMEFGKQWLQPIHERLRAQFTHLSPKELDQVNLHCEKVNRDAHRYVYKMATSKSDEIRFEEFKLYILEKYHWISEDNIQHLYSQSCYYAYK